VTVAAVVLGSSLGDSLGEVGGVAAIRRIADIAWAGGALPIVLVPERPEDAPDLEPPLAGAPGVVISESAGSGDLPDVVARLATGMATAHREVDGTDAALAWPGRYVHVDAETVTSLIEAHGVDREIALVPSYDGTPGWPVLVPLHAADALSGLRGTPLAELPAALRSAGIATHLVELGDPGITHDLGSTVADLPAFTGPPEPVGAKVPDWGERVPASDPSPAPPRATR
jgi:CTP:molybdopterin cytidylyltransferase MocA